MGFVMGTTITLFIIVSVFLILLILIQKGRGGGLASAFGGAGGNTAFGSKTGDVLTWATSIVFGIFLLLGIGLNLLARSSTADPGTPNVPAETSGAPASPQTPPASGLPPAVPGDAAATVEKAPDGPTGVAAPSTQPR